MTKSGQPSEEEIKKLPVAGILGVAPYATISFLEKIANLTPAKKDWEHAHLVIDNNVHIPSRGRHVMYHEASPVSAMIASCAKRAAYPVDFIVIPCNNASAYIDQVAPHISVPIINIVAVAASALLNKHPQVRNCAVLGGQVTYSLETYRKFLEQAGISYIKHSLELQKEVDSVIESIKLGNIAEAPKATRAILDRLVCDYGADSVIFGCTELGCIEVESPVPCIDSSSELAAYVAEKGRKPK